MSLTAERLEERKAGIGGSEIAAVLGKSPYKTPLDVYNEKTGQVEPEDISGKAPVEWGNRLEDVVADKFADDTGLKIRRSNMHLQHKEHEFLKANIDRGIVGKIFGGRCGLECKTASAWAAKPEMWGPGAVIEPGAGGDLKILQRDDQVPIPYLLQCAHYMAVTDSNLWFLAVLIGGNDFRTYTIFRNEKVEAALIKRAGDFWWNNVKAGIAPEPSTVADVESLYPIDDGEKLLAQPELIQVCQEAKQLQAEIKERDKRLSELKDQIKLTLGGNGILVDDQDQTLATWKGRKIADKFDAKQLAVDHPEIFEKYNQTGRSTRVLLIK